MGINEPIDMRDEISALHASGQITDWQRDFYLVEVEDGISRELFACLLEDADVVKELNINSDVEWDYWNSIYIYAQRLFNDCHEDIYGHSLGRSLTDREVKAFKKYLFINGREIISKFSSAVVTNGSTYHIAKDWIKNIFNNSLSNIIKDASICISYINMDQWIDRPPQFDVSGKWIDTLTGIYNDMVHKHMDRRAAIDMHIGDWDDKEVEAFNHWMKYYEGDEHKKYNLKVGDLEGMKKMADDLSRIPDIQSIQDARQEDERLSQETIDREKDIHRQFKRWRKALEGRLCSAIFKVLPELQLLIDSDRYNHINDALMDLLKFVNKLRLSKDEGMEAILSRVEDRLVRVSNICNTYGFTSLSENINTIVKESCSTTNFTKWGAAGLESVVQDIEKIEEILKSRQIIRQIMRIDVQLAELGMASYFPELGDAIAKLFESFSYSSNKISEVVSRLRGGERAKALHQKENIRVTETAAPAAPAPAAPSAPAPAPPMPGTTVR